MTENEKVTQDNEKKPDVTIPKYRLAESALDYGVVKDIVPMQLEDLVFEKMYILFEKHEPCIRSLKKNKLEYQDLKDKLLREIDFQKELGITTKPTIADKDAVMKPYLAELEEKIEKIKENIAFYENKITILNDLIKTRRLQLKIEAAINE